jgi:Protein of unknown function (DUF2905)
LFALKDCFEGLTPKIASSVMYSFLKIFIVVVLALALIDWLADRDRRADTNIPDAKPGWALLSGDIKIASANANENPIGTVPPGESFLPGDIKYESSNGNVRIYFPIVTAIILSVLFTLILRFIGTKRTSSMSAVGGNADIVRRS